MYEQLQILREAPLAALSAEWEPISEPFWRCEWESRFSKLFLPKKKSMAHSELPVAHWVFQWLILPPSLQPTPLLPLAATVKKPYAIFLSWLVTPRSLGGMDRGERLSNEGREGEERDGVKVLKRSKGFYRKSIVLFHFLEIWLWRDKARAPFPRKQWGFSSH